MQLTPKEVIPIGSVAKDQVLSLGFISCTVRVESALYTEESLTNCCVAGHEPMAVQRPLHCPSCGPIQIHTTKKAKRESGGLVILEDEELETLKSTDAEFKGKIGLMPYDAEDVILNTAQGEKLYFLTPQSSPENLALITAIVRQYPQKMFVARYTIRTKASLFLARIKGDCLMLEERVFQSNLKPVPTMSAEVNESYVPMAIAMVESLDVKFDKGTFSNQYQEHLTALTRSRPVVGGKTVLSAPVSKRASDELLAAALLEYRSKVSS